MSALGVLGTGQVGQAIARRAAEVGYDVVVGARSATSTSLDAFADDVSISTGSFSDAAEAASLLVNATNGLGSLEALTQIGARTLTGKTLVDVANKLRPAEGGFPQPISHTDDALGPQLQRAFPDTNVVKALNTMNCAVMVRPADIPGDHLMFLSGDSDTAKNETRTLLRTFGWRDEQMLDLGGIDTATETMMSMWMAVTVARGPDAPRFNWAALQSTSR